MFNYSTDSSTTLRSTGARSNLMDKNKKLFPQRLWELIHDGSFNFCLRWSEDGQRVYLNRSEFEAHYLKTQNNQFHTQKAISFVRQMNMYGFKKVDDCYYENENFKRHCPHLLKNMVRRNSNKSSSSSTTNGHAQTSTQFIAMDDDMMLMNNGNGNGMVVDGGHIGGYGLDHRGSQSLGDSDNEMFGSMDSLRQRPSEVALVQNYLNQHEQLSNINHTNILMAQQQQHNNSAATTMQLQYQQQQLINQHQHHHHQHQQQQQHLALGQRATPLQPAIFTQQQQQQVAELLRQVNGQAALLGVVGSSPPVSPSQQQQHENMDNIISSTSNNTNNNNNNDMSLPMGADSTAHQTATNNAAILSAVSALMTAIGTNAVSRTPLASSLYHRLAAVNFDAATTNGHQTQQHQHNINGNNNQHLPLLNNQMNLLDLNQNLGSAQLLNGLVADGVGASNHQHNNLVNGHGDSTMVMTNGTNTNGQALNRINGLNGNLLNVNLNGTNGMNHLNGSLSGNNTSGIGSSSSSSAASLASLISSQVPCQNNNTSNNISNNFNIADIPMGPHEAMLTRQAFQQSLVQSLLLLNQQQPPQNLDQNFLLNLQRQQQALQQLQQQQQALHNQQHQQQQQLLQDNNQQQQHNTTNNINNDNNINTNDNSHQVQTTQLLETEDSQVLPLKLTTNKR